jgi:predicted RNA-binding Zn-ribbon protein involved in translation (DUF1610 family)
VSCRQSMPLTVALNELLDQHASVWSGTAAELHVLLPAHAADAVRLAKALTRAGEDLTAAGITFERKRQPGTGARVLVLTRQIVQRAAAVGVTVSVASVGVAPEGERDTVTMTAPATAVTVIPATSAPIKHPDRPLYSCPTCGGKEWRWRHTPRRRASRWLCPTCEFKL